MSLYAVFCRKVLQDSLPDHSSAKPELRTLAHTHNASFKTGVYSWLGLVGNSCYAIVKIKYLDFQ